MGILDIFGSAKDLAEPIKAVGDLYTTDKARLDGEQKLEETMQKPVLAQIDLNRIFASAASIYNSGWIPLIGWTAGFLILLYYAPQIIIALYVWGKYCINANIVIPFPIKSDDIMNLVWLLFGFGGYSLLKNKIT